MNYLTVIFIQKDESSFDGLLVVNKIYIHREKN